MYLFTLDSFRVGCLLCERLYIYREPLKRRSGSIEQGVQLLVIFQNLARVDSFK